AQYIDDHRQIEKLVTEHLTDKRWQEVFLLVAGLMWGGADDLLLLMEKEAQKYINTPKSQALLNWATQITTGSAGDFKTVAKRAVAIAYATAYVNIFAIGYNRSVVDSVVYAECIAHLSITQSIDKAVIDKFIDNATSIANYWLFAEHMEETVAHPRIIANLYTEAISYTRQIKELKIFNNVNFTVLFNELKELKDKIPDNEQPLEMRLIFFKHLKHTLLNAFNLDPDIYGLSLEDVKALDNYLYANYLTIHCKKASVQVSPTTWEGIEARMLLIPSN
ncbi:NACHT C-terminal helical domain 2-containing protein, partial [Nostoc sp. CCY0012]|uniref:NACHT C-terminal helical domain 2-containing protein n=1 Tax=Nostoc sp. CCY0012 TaxID=1056123 RepID=UPI0039C66607